MKSVLMAVLLLSGALAFGGQEGRDPKTKTTSRPPEPAQGETTVTAVVDLSELLTRDAASPADATSRARKDEKGLCKVHHEAMKPATVPISYGLTPAPPYPPEVEEKLFPNGHTSLEGGCIVMPHKEVVVLQCPKCVRAKEKWLRQQSERRRRLYGTTSRRD